MEEKKRRTGKGNTVIQILSHLLRWPRGASQESLANQLKGLADEHKGGQDTSSPAAETDEEMRPQ